MLHWPHAPVRPEWLALRSEEIVQPGLKIIDAHHHLWDRPQSRYLCDELRADMASGHNVVASVYVQCRSMYRQGVAERYRPVGEVEFANGVAAQFASGLYGDMRGCAAIVGCVDLTLGAEIDPVLDRMKQIAGERLVGIRNSTAWHEHEAVRSNSTQPPPGLLTSPEFYAGVKQLIAHGLTLDVWAYHTQLPALFDLARCNPKQTLILDHVGGPLGVGPYKDKTSTVMAHWKKEMKSLARLPNVFVKLGGFGLTVMGYAFHERDVPPSSDELACAWKSYTDFVIDTFGPGRCMFESNFPVDKGMFSYHVLWNAFKKLSRQYSEAEIQNLFAGTASRIYSLNVY